MILLHIMFINNVLKRIFPEKIIILGTVLSLLYKKAQGEKSERRYAKTQQFNSDWFLNGGTVFFPFCILQYAYKNHVLYLEWEKDVFTKKI